MNKVFVNVGDVIVGGTGGSNDVARLQQQAKDAARYRALCEFTPWSDDIEAAFDCGSKSVIDAAIDKFMQAKGE